MTEKFGKLTLLAHPLPHTPMSAPFWTTINHFTADKIIANQQLDCLSKIPICWSGGDVGLRDLRAPVGAIIKVAGMSNVENARAWRSGRTSASGPLAAPIGGQRCKSTALTSAPDRIVSMIASGVRRKANMAPPNIHQTGALGINEDQRGPAPKGAAIDVGGKAKVVCYADI